MHEVMLQLSHDRFTAASVIVWMLSAFILSVAGGAIAGTVLAGKDLGNRLAALMGGMYGPVAAVPGILVALIVLALV
jgi:hypothetical protein